MLKSLKLVLFIGLIAGLTACSSRSVMPDAEEVKVSREAADKDCKELGKITGTTSSVKGTREQALEDLIQTAANKGANYVMVKQYSAQGTSVTGMAYECP